MVSLGLGLSLHLAYPRFKCTCEKKQSVFKSAFLKQKVQCNHNISTVLYTVVPILHSHESSIFALGHEKPQRSKQSDNKKLRDDNKFHDRPYITSKANKHNRWPTYSFNKFYSAFLINNSRQGADVTLWPNQTPTMIMWLPVKTAPCQNGLKQNRPGKNCRVLFHRQRLK